MRGSRLAARAEVAAAPGDNCATYRLTAALARLPGSLVDTMPTLIASGFPFRVQEIGNGRTVRSDGRTQDALQGLPKPQ